MQKARPKLLCEGEVCRVTRRNLFVPVKAIGEVMRTGVGAKAKVWYGVRFLEQRNPNGFMDVTLWEGEVRPLRWRERGAARKGGKR